MSDDVMREARISVLKTAMANRIEHHLALCRAIDACLPPTTTGYQWREESWTVRTVYPHEEDGWIGMDLWPPEHAHAYRYPTPEMLIEVREALGAPHLNVFFVDGKIVYRAKWPHRHG